MKDRFFLFSSDLFGSFDDCLASPVIIKSLLLLPLALFLLPLISTSHQSLLFSPVSSGPVHAGI